MPRINPNDTDHYQSELNGEWFQLKNDQDVARVQFMFDNYEDIDVFACHKVKVGDKERYVDCLRTYDQPIDMCPFCAAGLPAKPVRFVVMFDHGDNKVKIWERGKQFITKIQALMNRYSPLSEYVFEIERHGVAGSTDTKYEVFAMDRVDPYDLTEVERPEFLGGLILQKTEMEMNYYLERGTFPADNSTSPAAPPQINRRVPANQAPAQGSRRGGPPAQQTSSRRSAPPSGSRRGGEEVF